MDEQEERQANLRAYLRSVAMELVRRGMVRSHQGWTPVQILKQEPGVVFGFIVRDLSEAGLSVGKEIVGGVVQGLFGAVFGRR